MKPRNGKSKDQAHYYPTEAMQKRG